MTELALDLGANLGWCLRKEGGGFVYALLNLKKKKQDDKFDKYKKFYDWLVKMYEQYDVRKVYYEEVNFSYHTYSAQAHGAFASMVQKFGKDYNVKVTPIPVQSVKKSLTGRGNASKMGMIHFAEKYVDGVIDNDNIADAIGVMHCARHGVR